MLHPPVHSHLQVTDSSLLPVKGFMFPLLYHPKGCAYSTYPQPTPSAGAPVSQLEKGVNQLQDPLQSASFEHPLWDQLSRNRLWDRNLNSGCFTGSGLGNNTCRAEAHRRAEGDFEFWFGCHGGLSPSHAELWSWAGPTELFQTEVLELLHWPAMGRSQDGVITPGEAVPLN